MNRCAENVDFSGKSCSVCGVGVSNYPIIDYLLKSGAIVVARDIKPKRDVYKRQLKVKSSTD